MAKKKMSQYRGKIKALNLYYRTAALALVAALLLFFLSWGYIYNTDIAGAEVSFRGWAALAGALTQNFTTMGGIYQDLAVPFYYYAPGYTTAAAWLTLVAFIALAAGLVIQCLLLFMKAHKTALAGAILNAVTGIGLIAVHLVVLSMKNSDILPIYCSGNPACSIRSYALHAGLIAIAASGINLFAYSEYRQAQKDLR